MRPPSSRPHGPFCGLLALRLHASGSSWFSRARWKVCEGRSERVGCANVPRLLWPMPRRASGRIETRANDLSTAFTFPVRTGILGMSSGTRRFGRRRSRKMTLPSAAAGRPTNLLCINSCWVIETVGCANISRAFYGPVMSEWHMVRESQRNRPDPGWAA